MYLFLYISVLYHSNNIMFTIHKQDQLHRNIKFLSLQARLFLRPLFLTNSVSLLSMLLYTFRGISISTSSTCLSRVSLSTLIFTVCSSITCLALLLASTGVLPVEMETTLELLLLLESVLDLEWRLPLLAPSRLLLAAAKLMLGDFFMYSSVDTFEEDSDLG